MVSAFDVKFRNSFPIAIFSSSFIVSHFTSYSFIFLELILLHEVKGSNLVSPQMVSRFFSTPLSISNATFIQFSSFQLLSCVWLLQPHGRQHARLPCPSPTPGACSNSRPLSRWCHPTTSSSVIPFSCPIFSSTRVFSSESALGIRWPKNWSFSFSPSNEYSGLISFRMDWLDLLAVQETLKSLLQYHSSKASILQCSAFFIVQLSHPYVTTGKTTALTRRTFVGKVMSLLFSMLSRSVIAFFQGATIF